MNIKFRMGTHRGTLVFGPITFKFVIFPCRIFLQAILKEVKNENFRSFLKYDLPFYKFSIIRSLFANITEFFTWKILKAPFLAPTYFSFFGLINIQKTIEGEKVDCKKMVKYILDRLPSHREKIWRKIEDHSLWQNSGWRKTEYGYVLFDYGDCFMAGEPFSNVLMWDESLLIEILANPEL